MTTWLVSAWIETEVNHDGSGILGSNNIVTSISVRLVISEEFVINLLVDINTVSLDLDGLKSLNAFRVDEVALANLRQLGSSASKGIGSDQSRSKNGVVTSTDVAHKALSLHGACNSLVDQTGQAIPIAPEVNVTGSNSKSTNSGLSDVELGSHTSIKGLNGPLQVAQQNSVVGDLLFLSLESVDSDQGETNSLNVNIVNLGVNEDVVDVKLALVDVGGNNTRIAARQLNGAEGSITSIRSNSSAGSGTIGVGNNFSSQSQRNVTSGSGDDIINIGKINGNESLTIRNGNGGDGQSGILVEPEQQGNPPILNGLGGLRGLGTIHNETHLASVVRGVNRCALGSSTVDIQKTDSGSTIRASSGNGGELSEGLNGDFLADQSLPTSQFAGSNSELLVEHNSFRSIVIQRVSVDFELNLGEQSLTWIFNITNEVLSSCGGSVKNGSLLVNVVICVSGVRVGDGSIFISANRVGSGKRLVVRTNKRGEGRKAGNSAGRSSSDLRVDNHVIEEITELRN